MSTSLPPAVPSAPRYWTGGRVFFAVIVLLATFGIGAICGTAASRGASQAPEPAVPTSTAPATPTAAPTPIALSGQGSRVLSLTLKAGRYKVAWSAQGHDNFIVHLIGDNTVGVVNEIPPQPSSGETVLNVRDSATYQLQVEAATLSWTITLTPM